MAKGIESLTLRNFRGATVPVTFTFDAAKPIIMIFGENGSGKSTLTDALDFLCNNEFGSLKDKASANAKVSIVAQGAKANDLEVVLKYSGAEWSARMASGKPRTIGKDSRQPPHALILRRADILRIVELQPAKRYEAVREFISVPRIEESEAGLKTAKKEVDAELERATELFTQAHDNLEQLWAAEKGPGRDPESWARSQLRDDTRALQERVAAADVLLNAIEKMRDAHVQWLAVARDSQAAAQSFAEAAQRLSAAESGRQAGAEKLVAVLEEAQRYLQASGGADACPVCGKPEAPQQLRERVDRQLRELNDLVRLRSTRDQAERHLQQEQAGTARALRALSDRVHELAAARRGVGEYDAVIDQCLQQLPQPDADTLGQAVGESLESLLPRNAAWVAQRESDQKTLNLQNTLKISLETITDKGKESQSLTRLSKRLEKMLAVVSKHRKAYVEQQLQEIAGTVDAYYNRLHPNEGLGNVTLSLKTTTSGSVEMAAEFGGDTDISPTAYYSEAHLDTLGLCVYLALAGRAQPGSTLIVLDDVLTSLDEAHLERVLAMLREEAEHFGQLMLMMHRESWRRRFGGGADGKVQLLELAGGWTAARGIAIVNR
jgi:energy-coupling factor transporter ATP-binding protein EcfA2